MNPWKILEIARTADAREIKRAYARKLKATKPDEKPVEFQALHQAYKTALDHAARREAMRQTTATYDAEDMEESIDEDKIHEDLEQLEFADSTITEHPQAQPEDNNDNEKEISLRESEYDQLIAQVEALLKEKPIPDDPAQWSFLADSIYLLEDDFNWKLGRRVFQLFAEYGQVQVRRARGRTYTQQVPTDIVGFCDQIFSWKTRAYYLQMEFDQDFCADLFSQIERHEERLSLNRPNKGLRGGTFIQGNDSAKRQPTESRPSGSFEISPAHIFFALIVLANLARCVHQAPGY